ncbi:MAG: hypothetical protein EP330_03825 [Deltaproteobacteria bacterium]|nr:MAG: hypothetical protein EP330_03825 [Deltaproteobacteria bacterium]
MRTVAALLAGLAFSSPALAGGLGVLGTFGIHNEAVYYYDSSNDFAQWKMTQTIPNYGAGFELILGDRDDRILGTLRGYWVQDAPQRSPEDIQSNVAAQNVVSEFRDTPTNVGMASVGLQWGIVGSPDLFQLNAVGGVGSGFLTNDHTEFLFIEGGIGAHYQFARSMQAFGNVMYSARWRKGYEHGPIAYAGVRYLFD